MKKSADQFGALGSWKKIDEKFDETVIKQYSDASCVAAVGEMLAKHYGLNLSQTEILEAIGVWSNSKYLANFLNSKEPRKDVEWIGGSWNNPIRALKWITKHERVRVVLLRDRNPREHAVLVCGEDKDGLIMIKDPFDQTSYKMTAENLQDVLSEFVWRKKLK